MVTTIAINSIMHYFISVQRKVRLHSGSSTGIGLHLLVTLTQDIIILSVIPAVLFNIVIHIRT